MRAFATLLLLLLPASIACDEAAPVGEMGDRPSVILVVVDALRRDHLSLYGYDKPTSPALDALASESLVFDHCLAASSWTLPSTVSLLSGLYPARHGVHRRQAVSDEVELLPVVLQESGYATAAVSGNLYVSARFGLDRGFDTFRDRGGQQAREYPDLTELVSEAETWLETAPEPFFLYLHVMNVHGPYLSPEEYRERFLESPWETFEFRNPTWNKIMQGGEVDRRDEVSPEHVHDLRARYDGAISYTDEVLGGFVERLRARGVLDRSLLVVTSDHGEELFDHGGFGHGYTLRGEVVEVPLLLRLPSGHRLGKGRQVRRPVSLVDIPATLLDVAGIHDRLRDRSFGDGRSVLAGIGEEETAPRLLLSQLDRSDTASSLLIERWPYRLLQIERSYDSSEPARWLFRLDAQPPRESEWDAGFAEVERAGSERLTLLEKKAHAASPVDLEEPTLRQLEALGYVGGAPDRDTNDGTGGTTK